MANPIVEMNVKNFGKITLSLSPDQAPISVNNFLYLVQNGFYNGLTFHRVIRGFMIQGGCPRGNGTGSPGWSIKGEFKANGVDNGIKHKRGVLSMARTQDPNSASSQFFIMHKDASYLDAQYAGFGQVTEGLDVVDKIASVPTGRMGWFDDVPKSPVVIEKIERIED